MITVTHRGNFEKTTTFLMKAAGGIDADILRKYGEKGVAALQAATPVDTGKTANSWGYEIKKDKNGVSIIFTNSNVQNGIVIAIILQYGHATKSGGWVQGRDYISPALRPVFDEMAADIQRRFGH